MAKLLNMFLESSETETEEVNMDKAALISSLTDIIEMVNEELLYDEEIDALIGTIEFIADFEEQEDMNESVINEGRIKKDAAYKKRLKAQKKLRMKFKKAIAKCKAKGKRWNFSLSKKTCSKAKGAIKKRKKY